MFYRLIIKINNFVVRMRKIKVIPEHILLLLPHCLQCTECEQNIIRDINKCRRCGKCDIAAILNISETLGIRSFVVGGGREASRVARDQKNRVIVACACEKELVDGIRAAFPKPVIALANNRPNGPCRDTRADAHAINDAILNIVIHKKKD